MSTVSGLASKADKEKGSKQKYSSLNINNLYKGKSLENTKTVAPTKHGLQTLGKVGAGRRVPPPANLPSLKSETSGKSTDVSVTNTNQSGQGWTKQEQEESVLSTNSPNTFTDHNSQNSSCTSSGINGLAQTQQTSTTSQINISVNSNSNNLLSKTWSSLSESEIVEPILKKNVNNMPFLSQEFPSLDGGEPVQNAKQNSDVYGSGPSLRPQTGGNWNKNTANQLPGANLMTGNYLNDLQDNVNLEELDSRAYNSNTVQDNIRNIPAKPNGWVPPVNPSIQQNRQQNIYPNRYNNNNNNTNNNNNNNVNNINNNNSNSNNNQYNNNQFINNYQNNQDYAQNQRQFDRNRQQNLRYREEMPERVKASILTDKDMQVFDELLDNDKLEDWTKTQIQIDFNAKLNFSDDEDSKSIDNINETVNEDTNENQLKESHNKIYCDNKAGQTRYRRDYQNPRPHQSYNNSNKLCYGNERNIASNIPPSTQNLPNLNKPIENQEEENKRFKLKPDLSEIEKAKKRREEEERKYQLSRQAAQEKLKALEERSKQNDEIAPSVNKSIRNQDENRISPINGEEKIRENPRNYGNNRNNENNNFNNNNRQFQQSLPPRFQKLQQKAYNSYDTNSNNVNRNYDQQNYYNKQTTDRIRNDSQGSVPDLGENTNDNSHQKRILIKQTSWRMNSRDKEQNKNNLEKQISEENEQIESNEVIEKDEELNQMEQDLEDKNEIKTSLGNDYKSNCEEECDLMETDMNKNNDSVNVGLSTSKSSDEDDEKKQPLLIKKEEEIIENVEESIQVDHLSKNLSQLSVDKKSAGNVQKFDNKRLDRPKLLDNPSIKPNNEHKLDVSQESKISETSQTKQELRKESKNKLGSKDLDDYGHNRNGPSRFDNRTRNEDYNRISRDYRRPNDKFIKPEQMSDNSRRKKYDNYSDNYRNNNYIPNKGRYEFKRDHREYVEDNKNLKQNNNLNVLSRDNSHSNMGNRNNQKNYGQATKILYHENKPIPVNNANNPPRRLSEPNEIKPNEKENTTNLSSSGNEKLNSKINLDRDKKVSVSSTRNNRDTYRKNSDLEEPKKQYSNKNQFDFKNNAIKEEFEEEKHSKDSFYKQKNVELDKRTDKTVPKPSSNQQRKLSNNNTEENEANKPKNKEESLPGVDSIIKKKIKNPSSTVEFNQNKNIKTEIVSKQKINLRTRPSILPPRFYNKNSECEYMDRVEFKNGYNKVYCYDEKIIQIKNLDNIKNEHSGYLQNAKTNNNSNWLNNKNSLPNNNNSRKILTKNGTINNSNQNNQKIIEKQVQKEEEILTITSNNPSDEQNQQLKSALNGSSKSSSFDQQDSGIDLSDQIASNASSQRSSPSSNTGKTNNLVVTMSQISVNTKTSNGTNNLCTSNSVITKTFSDQKFTMNQFNSNKSVCNDLFDNTKLKSENNILDKYGIKVKGNVVIKDLSNKSNKSDIDYTYVQEDKNKKESEAKIDYSFNGKSNSNVSKVVGASRNLNEQNSPATDDLNLKIASVKNVWENMPSMPSVLEISNEESINQLSTDKNYEENKLRSPVRQVDQNVHVLATINSSNNNSFVFANAMKPIVTTDDLKKSHQTIYQQTQQHNSNQVHLQQPQQHSVLISSSPPSLINHINNPNLDNVRRVQNQFQLPNMQRISNSSNIIYNSQTPVAAAAPPPNTAAGVNIYQQFANQMKNMHQGTMMAQFPHPHATPQQQTHHFAPHQHILSQRNQLSQPNAMFVPTQVAPPQLQPVPQQVPPQQLPKPGQVNTTDFRLHQQNMTASHLIKQHFVQTQSLHPGNLSGSTVQPAQQVQAPQAAFYQNQNIQNAQKFYGQQVGVSVQSHAAIQHQHQQQQQQHLAQQISQQHIQAQQQQFNYLTPQQFALMNPKGFKLLNDVKDRQILFKKYF